MDLQPEQAGDSHQDPKAGRCQGDPVEPALAVRAVTASIEKAIAIEASDKSTDRADS